MRIFTATKPPISSAHSKASANGFTLIELLVVVFLIGLATAAVVLSLPGDKSVLRDDAERMAARIAAARDEAVLQSVPTAVWFRPSGYGFEQRRAGQWQPAIIQAD
jgi:general secretion pathway protein H